MKRSRDFQNSEPMVCVSVLDLLLRSSLFLVEFRGLIRMAIPHIVEHVKHSDMHVCTTAMISLSIFATHGLCCS